MNCRFAREMIALWVGNDLTQVETESVSRHVDACPDCQQHVEAMMNSSDVLDSFKTATLRTHHDSVWPKLEVCLTGPANERCSHQSRSALRSVGMLTVAALTFVVAILPDYVRPAPAAGDFFSSVSVSDVSTNAVSASTERRQQLPRNFVPIYLDPSWQILDGLDDGAVAQQHPGRRGSL